MVAMNSIKISTDLSYRFLHPLRYRDIKSLLENNESTYMKVEDSI